MKRESQIAFSNKSQAKSGMMMSRWLDRMISVGRARSSPNMDGTKEEEEHVQTFKSCEFSYPPAGRDIVPPSSVTHYRPRSINSLTSERSLIFNQFDIGNEISRQLWDSLLKKRFHTGRRTQNAGHQKILIPTDGLADRLAAFVKYGKRNSIDLPWAF